MATVEDVYTELRQVYDPEIPVNIVDLGLIYDVNMTESDCNIRMTLTSQGCPEARSIPEVVKRRVSTIEGIASCHCLSAPSIRRLRVMMSSCPG